MLLVIVMCAVNHHRLLTLVIRMCAVNSRSLCCWLSKDAWTTITISHRLSSYCTLCHYSVWSSSSQSVVPVIIECIGCHRNMYTLCHQCVKFIIVICAIGDRSVHRLSSHYVQIIIALHTLSSVCEVHHRSLCCWSS